MSKKTKASGRESTVQPELPKVEPDEILRRASMETQIIQELRGVERKLGARMEEQAKLKAKLDQVKDECKSLDARAGKLRMEVIDAHEGLSTGRLPFGATAEAEKVHTAQELGVTPAQLREAHYPNLLARINAGEEPSVSKAITIEGKSDLRYILIDVGEVYRLLALHAPGWISPSSYAVLPGLTGKLVDFMDAKLVIGHAEESPLVEVELPPSEKTTGGAGGRTDPGGATRGAAVDRARAAIGDSVDQLADALFKAGHLPEALDPEAQENQRLAIVMSLQGTTNPIRWLATASVDDLGTLQQAIANVTLETGKWEELGNFAKGHLEKGIPPMNQDDFDAPGEGEGDGDAPEGSESDQDEAQDDDDAPEGSEEGADAPKGGKGPKRAKRGSGAKKGAGGKRTKKSGK